MKDIDKQKIVFELNEFPMQQEMFKIETANTNLYSSVEGHIFC